MSKGSCGTWGPTGAKRAALAVARSILVLVYVLLTRQRETYHDLGGQYFDELRSSPP